MTMKNWQVAAATAASALAIAGAFGFMSPGVRAERNEKRDQEEHREFKEIGNSLDHRLTIVEANFANLSNKVDDGNARLELKLDKLIDLEIKRASR